MSTTCASRLLRAQGVPRSNGRRALTGMVRYARPQSFYGYRDTEPVLVDVEVTVYLVAAGLEFPPVRFRLVPGQKDDVLLPAPIIDEWGFRPAPQHFAFDHIGITVQRANAATSLAVRCMRV